MVEKVKLVFHDYVNVKLHFNRSDYMGTRGINNRILNSDISTRKDLLHFERIGGYFKSRTALIEYFVSGFSSNPDLWIGDFLTDADTLIDIHTQRIRRCKNIHTVFETDCEKIAKRSNSLRDLLRDSPTQDKPEVLNIPGIERETLSILNRLVVDFSTPGLKSIDPHWRRLSLITLKYHWFLKFSPQKILDTLQHHFPEEQFDI